MGQDVKDHIKEKLQTNPNITPTNMLHNLKDAGLPQPSKKQLSNFMYRVRQSSRSNLVADIVELLETFFKNVGDNNIVPISVSEDDIQFGFGYQECPFYLSFSSATLVQKCAQHRTGNVPAVLSIDGNSIDYIQLYLLIIQVHLRYQNWAIKFSIAALSTQQARFFETDSIILFYPIIAIS